MLIMDVQTKIVRPGVNTENLLTVENLASRIHKSVPSIRSDATRNPQSPPPICRLPGTKRLLWREADVVRWIAKYVNFPETTEKDATASTLSDAPKRSRGRPTKRQQIQRQIEVRGPTSRTIDSTLSSTVA